MPTCKATIPGTCVDVTIDYDYHAGRRSADRLSPDDREEIVINSIDVDVDEWGEVFEEFCWRDVADMKSAAEEPE